MTDRNGWIGVPYFKNLRIDTDSNTKIAQDSYEIYVNETYVGNKVLLGQNERIEDLEGYLKNRGFDHFTTTLEGNHYTIKANNRTQAHRISHNLSTYLEIR